MAYMYHDEVAQCISAQIAGLRDRIRDSEKLIDEIVEEIEFQYKHKHDLYRTIEILKETIKSLQEKYGLT